MICDITRASTQTKELFRIALVAEFYKKIKQGVQKR